VIYVFAVLFGSKIHIGFRRCMNYLFRHGSGFSDCIYVSPTCSFDATSLSRLVINKTTSQSRFIHSSLISDTFIRHGRR
jgi:hypothetical protein